MNLNFPQYRRYLNGKNYFRIDSLKAFEEIRSIGNRWLIEEHFASILPDYHLINDLLFDFGKIAEEITPETYNSVRALAV